MTEAAVREDGEAYPALYRATVHMYSKHATWCSKNGTRFSSFSHCVREQCAWTSARGQTHRPNGIRHRPRAAVRNRHTCSCWCAPGMTAGQRHGSRGQSPQRATLRHAVPPVHTHRGRVPCWWVPAATSVQSVDWRWSGHRRQGRHASARRRERVQGAQQFTSATGSCTCTCDPL